MVVGARQHVEQSLHHGKVVAAGRRLERLLHVVIARDERRVVPSHQVLGLGGRLRLPPAARRQSPLPRLHFGIGIVASTTEAPASQRPESVREVGRPSLHPGEQVVGQRLVCLFLA